MTPQQLRHWFAEDDPTIANPERITHVKVAWEEEYYHLACIAHVPARDLEEDFVARYAPREARTCQECGGSIAARRRLSWDEETAMKRRYDRAS